MPQWFVIYCTVNLFRLEMRNSLNVVSLLVVFVFLQKYNAATSSKMDRDTNNFCFWRSSAAHGARYSFLRESAGVHAVRLLQLYQSTWTEEQRLVECVLSDHPSVTGSYMSLCRGELADEFSDETDDRFNISQLLIPGGPCGTVPANDPLDLQVTPSQTAPTLRRHKRSWIFPGTLWCGTGSKAVGFGDLGVFNQTDQCCREHDHCEHTIAPFRVNFGVFNHHFFTVSHCNCDRRFRQCLLEVNDTVSHMVGFSFFTMLKVPCFRLTRKPYCTQLSWWGACKQTQVAPFAVFRSPALYNSMHLPRRHERVGVPLVTAATAGFQSTTCSPATVIQNTSHASTEACQSLGLRLKSSNISPPTIMVGPLTRPRKKSSKTKNTPPTWAIHIQTVGPRPEPSKNTSPATTTISPLTDFGTNTEDSKYAPPTRASAGKSEGPRLKLLNQPTTKPRKTSGTKKKPSKSTPPTKTSQSLRTKLNKTPSSDKASPLAGSKDKPSNKMSVAPNTTSKLTSSRTKIPKNFLTTKNSTSQSANLKTKHPKNFQPIQIATARSTRFRLKDPKNIPPTTTSQSTHSRAKHSKNIPATITNQSKCSRAKHPKNIPPTSQSTDPKIKHSKRPVGYGQKDPPRGDNFRGPRRKGKDSGRRKRKNTCMKLLVSSPTQGPTLKSTPVIDLTSLPRIHNLLGSADGMTVTQPWTPSNGSSERHSAEIRHKDRLQLCEYYRSLEECRYKILPQERQYMLFNAEAKVLYHCNCIHRLYRELRRVRYPMDTHMLLLLESLSPSCFVFKDCPEHSISRCPASLSQVEKFMLTLDTKKHKQGEKSLEEAAPTVKKDKIRKSLRRSASFRLHNKCLRITDFHE
ncbi:group 3 secretory phospholipase A2-like isoform X1 [Brienomyrus brachyistius]|uniref:group 3 secretory phospholipase A2-like isoform X1 n=1 Tax=Brienomyrus brachyistius TaxID=42636 RepID=UPI0020B37042|nr:group 3 secretory phospholipase A2-like isoform X1 [Brienomyrus brachyistius]